MSKISLKNSDIDQGAHDKKGCVPDAQGLAGSDMGVFLYTRNKKHVVCKLSDAALHGEFGRQKHRSENAKKIQHFCVM